MIAFVIKTLSLQFKIFSKYEDIFFRLALILFFISVVIVSRLPFQTVYETGLTAMIDIASFVAFTLFIVAAAQKLLKGNLALKLDQTPWLHVPFAAGMGLFPGCGGAIIVVTQFIHGKLSFGSLVATLIATMGDAMFLLISTQPKTALIVILVSAPTAIIFGYLIDALHGRQFMKPKTQSPVNQALQQEKRWSYDLTLSDLIWLGIMAVMIMFSLPLKFLTLNPFSAFGLSQGFVSQIAFIFTLTSLVFWAFQGNPDMRYEGRICKKNCSEITRNQSILKSIITTTNFVLSWALLAMIVFELFIHVFHIDLTNWLKGSALFIPLIAILIGFIPGCGPQIIVATLHSSGHLFLSAQLGNSISNDGDALFPALAAAPKAASLATLYSAIPAFIVAYGTYFLFETHLV